MTIIPLPLSAPEFRPVPPDWCYLCGYEHRQLPPQRLCRADVAPLSPAAAQAKTALHACDELCLPDLLRDWGPAHIETARELIALLQSWANAADDLNRRRVS